MSGANGITYRLPKGAGKAGNETMATLEHALKGNPAPAILYVITPEEIKDRDTGRWLPTFSFTAPSHILREMRGIISIAVDGFLRDHREIYEIPEVRAYFTLLHEEWRPWLHIADLNGPTLLVVMLAVTEDAVFLKRKGQAGVEVVVSREAVVDFLRKATPACGLLNHCARLSSADYRSRIHEVGRYLKLN